MGVLSGPLLPFLEASLRLDLKNPYSVPEALKIKCKGTFTFHSSKLSTTDTKAVDKTLRKVNVASMAKCLLRGCGVPGCAYPGVLEFSSVLAVRS